MKRNKFLLAAIFILISTAVYASQIVRLAPLTIQVKSSVTTVSGTAVKVPTTALVGRESIAIYNVANATEIIWCGGSDVTSANGFPLTRSAPILSLDLDSSVDVYCISDGTAVDVRTLEVK